MKTLIPTYKTEEHISLAALLDVKDKLEESGVEFVQEGDFNFYLEKNGIKLHGTLGHFFGEVELFVEQPSFIGPITSELDKHFQVDFALEHEESQ
ncbi:MAG: hypothetical protein P8J32_08245 [bacterium]|nr:hypothetical protein [bacterium]